MLNFVENTFYGLHPSKAFAYESIDLTTSLTKITETSEELLQQSSVMIGQLYGASGYDSWIKATGEINIDLQPQNMCAGQLRSQ